MKKANKKLTYNILGYVMIVIGLIALIYFESLGKLIGAFFVVVAGGIIVGGLPPKKYVKTMIKGSLVLLAIGVGAFILYGKAYGWEWAIRGILGEMVAVFATVVIIINGLQKLVKN